VHFDLKAVQHEVDKVTPRPVQAAVQDLVSPATDPDDDFANELIHMLMVGAVLQSFLSKRDLGGRPGLEGAHLLVDTSALVDLVDDGEPQQSVMTNLVSLSLRLGTQVFVAEHSLSEWDGLWLGAEQEQPWKLDNEAVPQNIDRLASGRRSPFIKQFLRQKAHEPKLTWQRFASQRRNIRGRLESLGVTIRPAGNTSDEDRRIATGVAAALRELSADERVRGKRTRTTAAADGESAAMVARWRMKYVTVPCSSYFIAKDHLTALAYRQICPEDAEPITVSPAAWLVYVASITADDPNQKAELAEIVGSAVVRDSFLGLATSSSGPTTT
jgi:hypothetical protein